VALARGIPIGIGNIVNLLTNRFYTIPAGFQLTIDYQTISTPIGHALGSIHAAAGRAFAASFSFREHDPAALADLFGGTAYAGSSETVRQLRQESGVVASNELELSNNVEQVESNVFALFVSGGGEIFTPVSGAPDAGEVQWADGDATLSFNAADEGKRVSVRYLTEHTDADKSVWIPSPSQLPQSLRLFAALRLKEPYGGAEIGDAVGIYIKSATLDGSQGPIGAPVADMGSIGINVRCDFIEDGDIAVHFCNE
jgi:hypothetical protein